MGDIQFIEIKGDIQFDQLLYIAYIYKYIILLYIYHVIVQVNRKWLHLKFFHQFFRKSFVGDLILK